jgi:hypothetical protein
MTGLLKVLLRKCKPKSCPNLPQSCRNSQNRATSCYNTVFSVEKIRRRSQSRRRLPKMLLPRLGCPADYDILGALRPFRPPYTTHIKAISWQRFVSYDEIDAESSVNSTTGGDPNALKVSVSKIRAFHAPDYGMMNMSHKLIVQLFLGFLLSSVYLAAFFLAVHQQQTSYVSLTQAHAPQKFLNTSAEERDHKTLKTTAAAKHPSRPY